MNFFVCYEMGCCVDDVCGGSVIFGCFVGEEENFGWGFVDVGVVDVVWVYYVDVDVMRDRCCVVDGVEEFKDGVFGGGVLWLFWKVYDWC